MREMLLSPRMTDDRARFHYLDGLRGWAALFVVVFHASAETFGHSLYGIRAPYLGLLNDGKFAVPIFFALSGFVLSRSFIATRDHAGLQRMAAGRYVRLAIPVGVISAIGFVMAVGGLAPTHEAGAIARSPWLSEAMTFPVPPSLVSFLEFSIFNVFTSARELLPYNQFTWTMTYELCGSYMLFATLSLFGDQTPLRRLALIVMCSISTYFDPLYGLFFGGALVAEVNVELARRPKPLASPALCNIVGAILFAAVWAASTFIRGRYHAVPALALLAALLISPWFQSAMQTRLSQWLGRISFPLYLVHGYVIFGPGAWTIIAMHDRGFTIAQTAALVVPEVVTLSLLTARLLVPVETIAKRLAHATGRLLTGTTRQPALKVI